MGPQEPPEAGVPMENPEYPPIGELKGSGFALSLPEGWVDRSIYCAAGPILEGFQSSLAVIVEHRPDLKVFKGYVDGQLKLLEGQLEGFALQEQTEKSVGGRPAEFAGQADLVIEPPVEEFPTLDFKRSRELIELGYRATNDALERWDGLEALTRLHEPARTAATPRIASADAVR